MSDMSIISVLFYFIAQVFWCLFMWNFQTGNIDQNGPLGAGGECRQGAPFKAFLNTKYAGFVFVVFFYTRVQISECDILQFRLL